MLLDYKETGCVCKNVGNICGKLHLIKQDKTNYKDAIREKQRTPKGPVKNGNESGTTEL